MNSTEAEKAFADFEWKPEGIAKDSWADFPYRVKGLKTLATPDGEAYTAGIYRGAKKVGEIHNGGHGGCDEYWFATTDERDGFRVAIADLFGNTWEKAMDSAAGAFLLMLYDMTRISKKSTVLFAAGHERDWFWERGYDRFSTTNISEVEAWVANQDQEFCRFDATACAVVPVSAATPAATPAHDYKADLAALKAAFEVAA